MKNLILIFLLAISGSMFAQTIRRVNNNPGITGVNVYTTIQAAHDAAVAGDIVYVEPSLTNYGSLVANKRLTIIGNGYGLADNTSTTFNKMESTINNFAFTTGSENSVLMGIVSTSTSANDIGAYNIQITKCKMQKLSISNSNATITKNMILQISQPGASWGSHLITNNILQSALGYSNSGPAPIKSSTISNNIIEGKLYTDGSIVTNNIFSLGGTVTPEHPMTGTLNNISNNISTYYTLPVSNGNFNSTNVAIYAVNPHLISPNPFDKNYQLAASSPAIGAGTGGTNCGIFGGANPYVLSGQPSNPIITDLNVGTAGNSTVPLNVSITVRGNN
jgi:hypothetical protein